MGSHTVRSGERGHTLLPVARMASGQELVLPLHVLRGVGEGPCILLVGVVHGEEIFAIDVIANALDQLDPQKLRGTVLAVPVANPMALAGATRNTPTDMLDLNRQFPGSDDGWLSERLAAALGRLVDQADVLLHIDGGSAERVIHYTFVKSRGGEVDAETLRLSRAFGMYTLYQGPQAAGSLTSYAAERGMPTVLAMIGGGPLYAEPAFLDHAVRGVHGVMRALEMIDGEVPARNEQRLLTRRELLRVETGGIFHPVVGLETIDKAVPAGTLLGTVFDPYTLEEVSTIRAPFGRSVLLQMRAVATAVQPGDYAYIVADLDSAVPT